MNVSLLTGIASTLVQSALERLSDASAPSTLTAYTTMFRLYIAFMVFTGTALSQVKSLDILAFLECLNVDGMRPSQMQNHLSAVRGFYVRFGLSTDCLDNPQIQMYMKALQRTAPITIRLPNLVDIQLLR